jgi:pimeloyl-ACP methyl ester carboxylesterase
LEGGYTSSMGSRTNSALMDYTNDFQDDFCYTSLGAIHFKHHVGTKQKLIFLPAIGSTTRQWQTFVKHLPDDLEIYLVDLLGHGESDAPDVDYTVSTQFQVLREFISMQNNGDSYIFGHSYGGWIAAYYATQPYTCKGIILEDCAGLKENFDEMIATGLARHQEEMMKAVMKVNNNKEHVMRSAIYANFEDDRLTSDDLAKIKVPTLIIWGANDNIVNQKYSKIFQNKIRGSKLEIIDGAGHEPHYEKPETVKDILLNFIKYQ